MMKFFAIAAIALGLSGCMGNAAPDWGGSVVERRMELGGLFFNRDVVARREVCASACTMYLTLGPERVCTTPAAKWGFHSAHLPSTGEISQQATELMVSMYPAPLQAWFWANAHGKTQRDFAYLSGATIIANGWAHEC